jgi:hypothetical protein
MPESTETASLLSHHMSITQSVQLLPSDPAISAGDIILFVSSTLNQNGPQSSYYVPCLFFLGYRGESS